MTQVRRDTPADAAGLNVDDEILAIDDFRVRADQLDNRLEQYKPGDKVTLLVARREQLLTLDVDVRRGAGHGVAARGRIPRPPTRSSAADAAERDRRGSSRSGHDLRSASTSTQVLNENFEDAKTLFLSPLMAIHYAHLVMLADRGIVSAADARALRDALDSISLGDVRARAVRRHAARTCSSTSSACSSQACGEDVAGRLHTARSRNDIDMTMYRMRQREFIARARSTATLELRDGARRPRRRGTARRCLPRTRTRSRRSRRRSRTTCSR